MVVFLSAIKKIEALKIITQIHKVNGMTTAKGEHFSDGRAQSTTEFGDTFARGKREGEKHIMAFNENCYFFCHPPSEKVSWQVPGIDGRRRNENNRNVIRIVLNCSINLSLLKLFHSRKSSEKITQPAEMEISVQK